MDLRKSIGEISGSKIIDLGDRIKVVFFIGEKRKEMKGVLINVDEEKIRINGDNPIREIKINNIFEITKLS